MPDTKSHWETVYLQKAPPELSWFQQEPGLSLSLISNTRLGRDTALIDVGGGCSRLVDYLCDDGYTDISVLDVSANALAHAQQRLAHKADGVNWYEEDVTRFQPPRRFALWHDRAVFHFLTSFEDRERYITVLNKAVEPNGHIIIMTFAIGGPRKCSGLDIVQYDVEKMTKTLGPGFSLVEAGEEMHRTPSGRQQKFAYFRFRAAPGRS